MLFRSRRITAQSHDELEPVRRKMEGMAAGHPELAELERQYQQIVKNWANKIQRLGVVVKGLWLLDFDTGDGYLCWKYPELRLDHYHDYESGFGGRRRLQEVIEELDPDWAHSTTDKGFH